MKLKLKLEALRVETFVVNADAAAERGTVQGFAKPSQQVTVCQFTCLVDDCQPTFAYSCVETNCCPLETARCLG